MNSPVNYRITDPSVPCCDVCNRALLDRTRPGVKKSTAGRRVAYEKEKCGALEDAIDEWRDAVLERDVPDPFFTPSYILPDEAVTKLSTLQLPLSRLNVSNFLAPQWIWWTKYGEELMDMMLAVKIPERMVQVDVEMEVASIGGSGTENGDSPADVVVVDPSVEAPVIASSAPHTATDSHQYKRLAEAPLADPLRTK